MSFATERKPVISWHAKVSGGEQIATIRRGIELGKQLKKAGLEPGGDFTSATFYTSSDPETFPIVLNINSSPPTLVSDLLNEVTARTQQLTGEKLMIRTEHATEPIPPPPDSQRIAIMNFGLPAYRGPDLA